MTPESLTVGEARSRYFAEAGFPSDGGYAAKFVQLAKLGPIPLGFPNSDARRKAVVMHDLHHVATGYKTDWTGEAEISAWEIASGCGRLWFAWYINLLGMTLGWVVNPGATWRAWVRGRSCCTSPSLTCARASPSIGPRPSPRAPTSRPTPFGAAWPSWMRC